MHSQPLWTIAELTTTHLYVWRGVIGSAAESSQIFSVDIQGISGSDIQDMDHFQASVQAFQKQWKERYSSALSTIDYLCITPNMLISLRTQGMTEIRQGRVAAYEMDEVFHSAKHIGLPEGYVLQYIQPLWYEIDQNLRVMDPIGLSGKRLEGQFHLVALPEMVMQYLKIAFKKAGISVGSFVVKPLILQHETWSLPAVSGQRLLISFEKEQCLVALLERDTCRFIASQCMSETLMDRDLSVCLGVSLEDAERIRKDMPTLSASQLIRRQSHGYDVQLVSEILQSRASEMCEKLHQMVVEQIRWELPLTIEVRSQALEYYLRPWLQRYFPNAEVRFHAIGCVEMSQPWPDFEAFGMYLLTQSSLKRHEVSGWRRWWNKCKNWIEYHL